MSMHVFPKEVWLRIFLHLDLPSIAALSRCSKFIHSVGESNVLWKRLFELHFFRPEDDDDTLTLQPTFDVEGGEWLDAADPLLCAKCGLEASDNDAICCFSDNCVLHRECMEGDPAVCPCGVNADDKVESRMRYVCSSCERENIPLICSMEHGGSEAPMCFLCDPCLLDISKKPNPECVCGANLYMEAIPLIRHQLASKRFLELDSSFEKIVFKEEYKRVFSAGASQVMDAAVNVFRDQWFDTVLGLGILFCWIILVLCAHSWLTWTKFLCLLSFALLVGVYMLSEGIFNHITILMRDGHIGPGFARNIWKYSRWSSMAGIGLTLILSGIFFGAVIWDAYLDFGWSVTFLAASLVALGVALYKDYTRAVWWILGICFFAVPVLQILFKFIWWDDEVTEDEIDVSFMLVEGLYTLLWN